MFDVAERAELFLENHYAIAANCVAQLASPISGALTNDDTDKWGVSDPVGGAGAALGAG